MSIHIDTARTLTDEALLARIEGLAAHERGTMAELIAHLAEVDARKLHLASGYGSMFTYCRGALRFSESKAYRRIEVARAARRFPVILDRLAEGAVGLTTVRLLAPHLTVENHVEVLESARGRSRPEVETIVARLAPVPDAATSIRKLPAPRPAATACAAATTSTPAASPATPSVAVPAASPAPLAPPVPVVARPEPQRAAVNALSPDRYKLQLTIDGETVELLRLAQDMSRHANPSGDESQILKSALTLLVSQLAKTKFAASDRPHRSPRDADPDSSHVPADVKRVVWVRDRGRCAFVGKNGHRCNERGFVEFHHVRPYAEGGPPTVENLELRCARHNRYEWELRSTEVRRLEDDWFRRQMEGQDRSRDRNSTGTTTGTSTGTSTRAGGGGRTRSGASSAAPSP